MNADQLRAMQAPLKARYKEEPGAALQTLRADATLGIDRVTSTVATFTGPVEAGLHPATGGDGQSACSGDMLLQALVACAGVTLSAVATALGVAIRGGTVAAEGDLDFRGTLGVSKEAPVGFKTISLKFTLDTDAASDQLDTLIKLTERYCVVFQTLKNPAVFEVTKAVASVPSA
jgi:uncharacterized OsmC-like protein